MSVIDKRTYDLLKFFVDTETSSGEARIPLLGLKSNGLISSYTDIQSLLNQNMIVTAPNGVDFLDNKPRASHYLITPVGRGAIEKYESVHASQTENAEFRKLQTNEIKAAIEYYKQDIKVAENANKIAVAANRKSSHSKWIAIGSMIGTLVSAVVAVIALAVSLCG